MPGHLNAHARNSEGATAIIFYPTRIVHCVLEGEWVGKFELELDKTWLSGEFLLFVVRIACFLMCVSNVSWI